MAAFWGSRKWQILLALFIIFILGYGTYVILYDLMTGHPIWWYNASFILFGFTLLGLLLLVREGWDAFHNLMTFGLHPDKRERPQQTSQSVVDEADNYSASVLEEEDYRQ
jgi:hypothetical protein